MWYVFKTGIFIFLLVVLLGSGIYFYLVKDGYQVIFNSNGGSIVEPIKTGLKEKVNKPDDPTRDDYKFMGWYLGENLFDFDQKVDSNITLTAHWQKEEKITYKLSFDTLGGNKIEPIIVNESETLKDIPKAYKDGYEFMGWFYHNQPFMFDDEIHQNMVFVASYKKKEESFATIHFDTKGGSEIEDLVIKKGSLAKMSKEPTREGYQFIGWFKDGEEFLFNEPIYDDVTLIAFWKTG